MPVKKSTKVKLWSFYFLVLVFLYFSLMFCCMGNNSIVTSFFESIGGNLGYAGILFSSFPLSAAVMKLCVGRMIDSKHRRLYIILGIAVYALSSFVYCFSTNYIALISSRILQGCGFSLSLSGVSATAADVIPPQRMGEGLGVIAVAKSLCMALGPMSASAFVGTISFSSWFISVGILLCFCTALAVLCSSKQDSNSPSKDEIQLPDNRELYKKISLWQIVEKKSLPASLLQFVVALVYSLPLSFCVSFSKSIGTNSALFFVLCAISVALSHLIAGKLYDKRGAWSMLFPGFVAGGVLFAFLLTSYTHPFLFYSSGIIYGIYLGLSIPALNAESLRGVPVSRRGVATTTYLLSVDLGVAAGGSIWGFLIEHAGFRSSFIVCIIVMSLFALFALFRFIKTCSFTAD